MVFHRELHSHRRTKPATVQTTDRKRVDSINVPDNSNLHSDTSPWISDFYRALKTEDLTPIYWFLDLLHRVVYQNQHRFSKTESISFNRRKVVRSPIHIALTQSIILFLIQNTDLQAHSSSGLAILVRSNTQVPPTVSKRECKSLCDKGKSPLLYTFHSLKPTFLSLIRTYFLQQKLTFLSSADGTWIFPQFFPFSLSYLWRCTILDKS